MTATATRVDHTRRSVLALLVFGALLGTTPAYAQAQDGSRQDASVSFTETKPGVSTGYELKIDYVNPADPAAKPPAVRTVVIELARGARYDTGPGAVHRERRRADGAGHGGVPAGKRRRMFLNNTGEQIFLNTERQSGARVVVRAQVGERTVTTSAPFLPGTPPDGAAIDTVDVSFLQISSEADGVTHDYVTTPSECPGRGYWTNRIHFTYYDGVTQTVETHSPCEVAKSKRHGKKHKGK